MKMDGNYTRMQHAILYKSWRQYLTRHQLYGHLRPITKTIQSRRTKHAGHSWRSRDELISDVLLWTPAYGRANQDAQHEHTFSSYVSIWDVALKTHQRRWTIGRSGERGSGISIPVARNNDDDDTSLTPTHCTAHLVVSKISIHLYRSRLKLICFVWFGVFFSCVCVCPVWFRVFFVSHYLQVISIRVFLFFSIWCTDYYIRVL